MNLKEAEYAKHNEIEEWLGTFLVETSQFDWHDKDVALKSTFDLFVGIWEIQEHVQH